MKAFFKKYIGLLISLFMIGLFFCAWVLKISHPVIANILVDIIAWYIAVYIGLLLAVPLLKALLWWIKYLNKNIQ